MWGVGGGCGGRGLCKGTINVTIIIIIIIYNTYILLYSKP